MTLAELLDMDYKTKSMTLEELQEALQTALGMPIINKQPPIATSITVALTAITVYLTVIKIYEAILALYPTIKLATKAAAIPLNPAMASEVAQDVLMQAQKKAKEIAIEKVKQLKETIMNTEIPGT